MGKDSSTGRGRAPTTLRAARVLVGLASLSILALTLFPTESAGAASGFECLICGERGLADAILNIILFMPLGMSLGLLVAPGRSDRRLLLYAFGLSLGVELAQYFIPGRDASPGDLLFNTIGGALGVLLTRHFRGWADPPSRRAAVLGIVAAAAAVGVFATTAMLLQPVFPAQTYYVMWTPDLQRLVPYDGRVLSARIRTLPLPPYPTNAHARWEREFMSGAPLEVQFIAGERRDVRSSILSTYDALKRELVMIGIEGGDVVFRMRTRAADLRLDQPDLRWRQGVAALEPGAPSRLSLRRHGHGYCMELNRESRCSGFTLGSGWSLLLYEETFPAPLMGVLNLLWIFLLAAPTGFWFRRTVWGGLAVTVLVGGLLLVPPLLGLLLTGPALWAAALSGGVGGQLLSRLSRSGG